MSKFKYVAKSADGSTIKDIIEATTPGSARTALAGQQLEVMVLAEKRSILKVEVTRKRVPRSDLMHLSRQLGAFIRAGVPILDAIDVIGEESGNSTLKRTLFEMGETLRSGDSFSASASSHPSVFPRFYVDMLRASELTGSLDVVLFQLADYLEREIDSRNKVKNALAYPAVILFMGIVVTGILVTFVLPRFEKFFQSLNATLPLATRILLAASRWFGKWWPLLLVGGISFVVALYLSSKSAPGKRLRDKAALRLPIMGGVLKYIIIERFARVLSTMVYAGVPLPEALTVAAEGTNNFVYEDGLDKARAEMLSGEGISKPLGRTKLFPPAIIQMVRVGEETGTLDQQLENAADFYDKEVTYKIKQLTTIFEPSVIIAVGVVVGFVAIAVISAMYGIFRQVGSL